MSEAVAVEVNEEEHIALENNEVEEAETVMGPQWPTCEFCGKELKTGYQAQLDQHFERCPMAVYHTTVAKLEKIISDGPTKAAIKMATQKEKLLQDCYEEVAGTADKRIGERKFFQAVNSLYAERTAEKGWF